VRIFAIGDLHLSFCRPVVPPEWDGVVQHKPMDVFGAHWHHHFEKIFDAWINTVKGDDLVLVPGDISWAMTLPDASYDLAFLGDLPGNIILIQGNHDYWWGSISRVREALPGNVFALQNDSICFGATAICGTRGWICPNHTEFTDHDQKVYQREIKRLEMSLNSLPPKMESIYVMMHFMPSNDRHEWNGFIELMERYQVKLCVYGHLHQGAYHLRLPEEKWHIGFSLVSADYLDFTPKLIGQVPDV